MTNLQVEDIEAVKEVEELLPVIEEVQAVEAPPVKIKKPRSQAQIDAFVKVRAKRDENRVARLKTKEDDAVVQKAQIEEKIVKKAVSIRKKQIVREAVLDDISDEDIPVDIVKKLVKRYPKKAVVPVAPAPVAHVKQAIVFI